MKLGALFSAFAVASLPCVAAAQDVQPALAVHTDPAPGPNYLRPALEIATGLGAASIWYWVDDRNVLDWDNPSAEERLNGEAWRFDNNTFALNYFWHPLAGAGMYVLARGNRLGVGASFGYSLAGSTLWEYVIEFKEKVSINDMLITPLAGLAVGEFFHKLALYLSSVPPRGAGQQALAWTLGLSVHGHRRLDGLEPPPARALDRLGYAAEPWHDLSLHYGFGVVDGEGARGLHVLGVNARFVSLPGYQTARRLSGWFHDAEFASLNLEFDLGAPRLGAVVFGETLLAGYHQQNIERAGGRSHGSAFTAGLGVAYTYRTTEAFGFDDRQGLLYVPGFRLEASRAQRGFRVELGLRVAPSFGSMSAPSYDTWRLENMDARTKTALERESYFFGWGGGASAEARLGAGDIEIRGGLAYDRLVSIEGLDRTQERVTRDAHLAEDSLRYGASAWITPETAALEIGLVFEQNRRRSRVEDIQEDVGGQRLLLRTVMPL